ncbi:MAG: AI-2E family transporter [Deltaproteobacteria bacterium]|nr:AI-2E family transporter [Deltaproteobacteria bacterium]
MDRKIYLSIMAALATVAALWLLAFFVAPFGKSLAWSLIIGIATIPHYEKLARQLPRHPNCSAGIMVLVITLCIMLPVAAPFVMIAQNATEWYSESERLVLVFTQSVSSFLSHLPLGGKLIALGTKLGIDLTSYPAQYAANASQFLLDVATSTAKNMAELFFVLVLSMFILFFIYRDGEKILFAGLKLFATHQKKIIHYLQNIRETTTSVIVGTLLTCLLQGALAGIGYFFADVPAPVLCAILTAVAAVLPTVGTAIIWVPLVVIVAINVSYAKAVALLLWCAIVVSLSDNLIRPLVIGGKSNISALAIILGVVSGVVAMGLIGLILGPLFFAILTTIWRDVTGIDESGDQQENQTEP